MSDLQKYRVPAFCPLCGYLMKGKSTITYMQYGVCVACSIEFIEGREERWKSGWRPSQEALEAHKKFYAGYLGG